MSPVQILRTFAASLFLLTLATGAAQARIIRVEEGATGDGSSWGPASAMGSLQDAIVLAVPGDQIWVKVGTYKPDEGTDLIDNAPTNSFSLKSGVAIYGGFAGTENALGERNPNLDPDPETPSVATDSLLNGDLDGGAQSFHVVRGGGADSTAILDGFTILNGFAQGASPDNVGGGLTVATPGCPTINKCYFIENHSAGAGAGSYIHDNCGATFTNCVFYLNQSLGGGAGLMIRANCNVSVSNTTFKENYSSNFGGGIFVSQSKVVFRACTLDSNVAALKGGAMYTSSNQASILGCIFRNNSQTSTSAPDNGGGAIYNEAGGNPIISRCTFDRNTSSFQGGAMMNNGSAPLLLNCLFTKNSSPNSGGAIMNTNTSSGSSPSLVGCVFLSNYAGSNDGGAIWCNAQTSPTFTNCTFAGNVARRSGGAIHLEDTGGPPHIRLNNCVLWGNVANTNGQANTGRMDEWAQIYLYGSSTATIKYCDLQLLANSPGGHQANLIMEAGNIGGNATPDNPDFTSGLYENISDPGKGPDDIWGTDDDILPDVRLQSTSPCIDKALNGADTDQHVSGVQKIPGIDIDGRVRRFDVVTVADCSQQVNPTDCGTAPIIDMGAYEFGAAAYTGGLYVDAGADGAKTALDWLDACVDLQDALAVARAFPVTPAGPAGGGIAEIYVAKGTYMPNGRVLDADGLDAVIPLPAIARDATFQLVSGVSISGGYPTGGGPRDADPLTGPNMVKLSGDLDHNDLPDFGNNGNNAYHVATGTGTDGSAVLDGVTIEGGNADIPAGRGGGLNADPGSPRLLKCTFTGNSATSAGAVNVQGYYGPSAPVFESCRFVGNRTTSGAGGALFVQYGATVTLTGDCRFLSNNAPGGGGALYVDEATVNLTNCIFTSNTADADGGAVYSILGKAGMSGCTFSGNQAFHGGAIRSFNGSSLTATDCTFSGNQATGSTGRAGAIYTGTGNHTLRRCEFSQNTAFRGGALFNEDQSFPTLANCTFVANSSTLDGGAIMNLGSSPPLINCVFTSNTAAGLGGAMYSTGLPVPASHPIVANCTFSYNSASVSGGAIYVNSGSSATLRNSVFWNDTAPTGPELSSTNGSTLIVSHCNVQGGQAAVSVPSGNTLNWGNGNIPGGADPLFVNAVDPDGPDDQWGTADDGLRLIATGTPSPCIDAGSNDAVPEDVLDLDQDGNTTEKVPVDLGNGPRRLEVFAAPNCPTAPGTCGDAPLVDMGAYEAGVDCNGNGTDDVDDIQIGGMPDCNGNLVPDTCEIDQASTAPGGPFFCTANCDPDCNNNGIPDVCDVNAPGGDCNQNGIPDSCDIVSGFSRDCNGDGRPDNCEIDPNRNPAPPAINGPYYCDSQTTTCDSDCDNNGVLDACDADCNGNQIPDTCDIDACLVGDPTCQDCNANGRPDGCDIAAAQQGSAAPMTLNGPLNNPPSLLFPLDGSYTQALGPNDDESTAAIPLPFTFDLYGQSFDSVYINNNGNVTCGAPLSCGCTGNLPNSYRIVAAFWGDVDTRPAGSGVVWYKTTAHALIVTWDGVGYYPHHADKLNRFQLAISDGFDPTVGFGYNVVFSYADMQWATSGSGFGGSPATVGANKGDGTTYFQIGRFDHAGTDYDGPGGNPDGVDYLDGRVFRFATQENVAPIATDVPSSPIELVAHSGQPLDATIHFLSPEPTQITSVTLIDIDNARSAGLQFSTTPNNTADATLSWAPDCNHLGTFQIELRAEDNFDPPGITTVPLTIQVSCPGSPDCNDNGIPDECDLADGTSQDANADQIPDECQVVNLTRNIVYPTIPQAIAQAGRFDQLLAAAQRFTADPVVDFSGKSLHLASRGAVATPIGGSIVLANEGFLEAAAGQDINLAGSIRANVGDRVDVFANHFQLLASGTLIARPAAVFDIAAGAGATLAGISEVDAQAILAFSADLTLARSMTLYGGVLAATQVNITSPDGAIIGYGDVEADVINGNNVTLQADTQVVGDYTNNGTTTVQNGLLTIIGTLTNNGIIIGNSTGNLTPTTSEMADTTDAKAGSSGSGKSEQVGPVRWASASGEGLTVTGDYSAGPAAMLLMPSAGMTLKVGGHFNVAIADNGRYDMVQATLQMVGLAGTTQSLEVMSADIGPSPFGLRRDLPGHYPIGTLRIGPTPTTATLVDSHDNDAAGQGRCEAIYVDSLVIDAGTTLNTGSCRIYYLTLTNAGTVDHPSNLVPISTLPIPCDYDHDGDVDGSDYAHFSACASGPEIPTLSGCQDADLDADNDVDQSDFGTFQRCYSGQNRPGDPNCAN